MAERGIAVGTPAGASVTPGVSIVDVGALRSRTAAAAPVLDVVGGGTNVGARAAVCASAKTGTSSVMVATIESADSSSAAKVPPGLGWRSMRACRRFSGRTS